MFYGSHVITQREETDQKCSPSVSFLEGRDLTSRDISYERNITLLRERMELPVAGDMEDFFAQEFPVARLVVFKATNGDDANTALFQKLESGAFSCGVQGLCGCTSLVVISRKGVYATHWWDSIAFSPDVVWRIKNTKTGKTDRTMQSLSGLF